MTLIRVVQIAWACALVAYAYYWLKVSPSVIAHGFAVFIAVYLCASFATILKLRWAWGITLVQVAILWLWFAAFLTAQVYAAVFTDLYIDSPATAIVVVIFLLPTLGPSSLILWLSWRNRDEMRRLSAMQ